MVHRYLLHTPEMIIALGFVDPRGLFALPLAIPIGQALVDAATVVLGGAMIADSLSGDDGLQQEIEKGANNAEYHRICNEPPPPNFLTPCDRWLWELQKAKSCLASRKAFTDKWHNGVDNRHDPQTYDQLNN